MLGGVYLRAGSGIVLVLVLLDLDCGAGALFFFAVGTVLLLPEFIRLVGGMAGGVDLGAGATSYLGG